MKMLKENDLLYQMTPWSTVVQKVQEELSINIKNKGYITVDDFLVPAKPLEAIHNFENLSDKDIFERIKRLSEISGEVFVITDVCYRKEFGPFIVSSERLDEFVCNHELIFSERFVETDVLIISLCKKLVWMFHHSGYVGLLDYKNTVGLDKKMRQ